MPLSEGENTLLCKQNIIIKVLFLKLLLVTRLATPGEGCGVLRNLLRRESYGEWVIG